MLFLQKWTSCKSAYRNIPVHPGDRHLVGMRWQSKVFIDTCLLFRLYSAPKIFSATADALKWIIANEGRSFVEFIIHYLDDSVFGASQNCGRSLALCMCSQLGFPVMSEKVFGPSTLLDFLGFSVDTIAMEIWLQDRRKASATEASPPFVDPQEVMALLSLIGSLQRASAVVIDLSKQGVHLDA